MKKKLLVLMAIIATVGFFGYTSFAGMKTEKKVNLSWEIKENDIEQISLLGAEQNVDVIINETENEYTTVSLTGGISQDSEAYLKNTIQKENTLEITLADLNKFRLMTTANGKDTVVLTVQLGRGASFKQMKIDNVVGNVKVKMATSFDGIYELDTNDQGEIKAIPQTQETSQQKVIIDTLGDITVEK